MYKPPAAFHDSGGKLKRAHDVGMKDVKMYSLMDPLVPSEDCRAPPAWGVLCLSQSLFKETRTLLCKLEATEWRRSAESYRCVEADVLFQRRQFNLTVFHLGRHERVDLYHLLNNVHVWHWHKCLTHQRKVICYTNSIIFHCQHFWTRTLNLYRKQSADILLMDTMWKHTLKKRVYWCIKTTGETHWSRYWL